MPLEIIGHAIVSADGMIADRNRRMPAALRNDADWRRFQAALDRSDLHDMRFAFRGPLRNGTATGLRHGLA